MDARRKGLRQGGVNISVLHTAAIAVDCRGVDYTGVGLELFLNRSCFVAPTVNTQLRTCPRAARKDWQSHELREGGGN